MTSPGIALIGDYSESVAAHRAIPVALAASGASGTWIHTGEIVDAARLLRDFAGVWCVPASPYSNMQGALDAIRFARESGKPFLGTCGGFQHAVIEYARNVLGIASADHAETNPDAECRVVAPLTCSLIETGGGVFPVPGTRLFDAYGGASEIHETYHCNYGLNPKFERALFAGPLRVGGRDAAGEVRALELPDHPFFVATLFQPERVPDSPLVRAFARACGFASEAATARGSS